MLLNNLLIFVSAAAALPAATNHKRDDATELATATLVQDVDNINTGVVALSSGISAFPGTNLVTTLVSGIEVFGAVAAIHLANRKGYVDALASPTLDSTESARVVDEVVNTVGNTIPDSVSLLETKKQALTDAGLDGVVVASLKLLLNDHDTFSAAVESKFQGTPDVEAEGVAVVAKIHDAIQGGIDDFSS